MTAGISELFQTQAERKPGRKMHEVASVLRALAVLSFKHSACSKRAEIYVNAHSEHIEDF